jgi:hypothetical protein
MAHSEANPEGNIAKMIWKRILGATSVTFFPQSTDTRKSLLEGVGTGIFYRV